MNWHIPSAAQKQVWQEWLDSRPARVRAVAERFDPSRLYRLKNTGALCRIFSFSERPSGVTLKVIVVNPRFAVPFPYEGGEPPDGFDLLVIEGINPDTGIEEAQVR